MSNTSNPITNNSNYKNKNTNHLMISGGEKKFMKKILSVALSTAMAFSMFASVAFGQAGLTDVNAQYSYLKDKGIFSGFPDEQAHLDRQMTRAEFAKVITKTLGLKEINGVYSFKDKNYGAKHWAAPFVEAVSAAGIMEGKNTTKKLFDLSGPVSVQEMATVLVRALDLEVPTETNNSATAWAKGYVQAAINAGLVDANANFQSNASRALLVGAAYAVDQELSLQVKEAKVIDSKTVEVTMTDGEVLKVTPDKELVANTETEVKFQYQDRDFSVKVTYVVTTATKVDKVSASNLKEIDVAFDGTVDKSTAEDKDRYSVDSSVTIDSAALQADGKTVRLTLTGSLTNQKQYKISVRNVKAGDKTVSISNYEFTPLDNALPEVVAVKSLGTKAVKVTFSEPVKSATSANFKLDGKTFFGSVTEGARDVILKPYTSTDLAVGSHKIEISGVEDFNGFKALTKSVDFEVVSDTTAPTIANVTATLEKATVTFSEEVDPETVLKGNVYWKSGSDKKVADSVTQVSPEVYEFSFKTNAFPGYETPFFVEGVKDYSGNQITATETKLKAEVDQTRPEVTEVKLSSSNNKRIDLKFSKEVKVEDVKYFTLTNSKGEVIALKNVVGANGTTEDKTFELTTYDALNDNSTYTLKIVGVRDTTKLGNTMLDYSATVTGKDLTAPTITSNSGNSSTRTLYINFSEKLDPTTAGDKSNYLVVINGTLQQLPSGTEVTPVNEGKAVRIIFPQYIDNDAVGINNSGFAANITAFKVLALKDLSGNVISQIGANVATPINTEAAKVVAYETGDAFQAKLTSAGTIKVRFDQPISSAKASDFTTTIGAVTAATADGTDLVTVTISGLSNTALATQTGKTNLELNVASGNTLKTVTGNSVAASEVVVKDAVSPVVKLADNQTRLNVSGNVIQLPFSETLRTSDVDQTEYRYDLIVTNIRTGAVLDYNQYSTTVNTTDNSKLDITITAPTSDDYKVSVKSDASFIQDRAGNKAAASSTYSSVAGNLNTVVRATGTQAEVTPGAVGSAGTAEVNKLTITKGSSTAGDITVNYSVNGTVTSTKVTVAADDNADAVASKIATAIGTSLTGYTVSVTGNVVTFTATAPAADKGIYITIADAATPTGVTGNDDQVTAGVAPTAATPEVNKLTVTRAANSAGTYTATFNDATVSKTVSVSVAATDTEAQIATKIADAFNTATLTGYTVTTSSADVIFTANTAAADKTVKITFE